MISKWYAERSNTSACKAELPVNVGGSKGDQKNDHVEYNIKHFRAVIAGHHYYLSAA